MDQKHQQRLKKREEDQKSENALKRKEEEGVKRKHAEQKARIQKILAQACGDEQSVAVVDGVFGKIFFCATTGSTNATVEKSAGPRKEQQPDQFYQDLKRCENECSHAGTCSDGKCHCNAGRGDSDCSLILGPH